jgi:hypothetical protein
MSLHVENVVVDPGVVPDGHGAGTVATRPSLGEKDPYTVSERGSAFCWVSPYPPPAGRRCTNCKEFLPFSAFRPNLKLSSGWNSWCRACCVERTRQWRAEHPEQQQLYNERRRVPLAKLRCVECGVVFEGRKDRLVCSRRCKDARYRRLHPEAAREKQRRKDERRRIKESSPD